MLSINHVLDEASLEELILGLTPGCHGLTLLASAKMEEKEMQRLFSNLQQIHSLKLQNTLMDNETKVLALSRMIGTSPMLRELVLTSNLLFRVDWIFTSAITALNSLSICDNIISSEDLHVLIQELQSPCATITKLQLVRNQIDVDGTVQFATNLPSFHTLRDLEFSGNFLGLPGSRSFALALPKAKLKHIALNNDQLGGEAFLQLFANENKAFAGLSGRFSVSHNQLMQSTASVLSRMLCMSSLTELDVSHNHLGDVGAQVLSKAIPKSQLRVLVVSSNKITTPGVSSLAKAARHVKSKLIVLDVSFNEFGNVGALSLLKSITTPTCRLQSVKHHCNRISGGLSVELDRALLRENTRKTLVALRSAQQIRRLGKHSEARWLPSELLRMLACMIIM